MRPWGYWATLGWALLAFLVSEFAALTIAMAWQPDALDTLVATPYDGVLLALLLLIANPIMIGLLMLAARLRKTSVLDYLALMWPTMRFVGLGLLALAGLIVLSDLVLYFTGQPLVTPFQFESYTTAGDQGWLAALLVATIIVAPAGEEILFRGFLFRGWARSERTTWPAIAVIAALWAAMHVQYDWIGIGQIFVVGLFLGWIRWQSGSTLLTFVLHALFNLEGMVETALQVHGAS